MTEFSGSDAQAIAYWGDLYAKIPKSVFALAAWHLADCCSDVGVGNGGEIQRFLDEIRALRSNDLLPPAQANRIVRALIEAMP